MSEQFSDEEIARLKELAQDLNAYGRVMRKVRAGLIWLAGGVTAFVIVWETFLKHIFWRQ